MERNSEDFKMHPLWYMKDGVEEYHLGLIPFFLNVLDERPAAQQINDEYQHGGGWRPQANWQVVDSKDKIIQYIDGSDDLDEPLEWIAFTIMPNGELVYLYPYAMVAIYKPNGDFEVCRLD